MENRYDHPSFSSTLLDSIYRSFDESSHDIRPSSRSRSQSLLRGNEYDAFFEELMFKKQISSRNYGSKSMIDDDEQVIRRRSMPPETTTEYARLRSSVISSERRRSLGSFKVNSSPASSSDSGSGGRLSSSDADLFYASKNKKNALKPIRTGVSETFRPQLDPRPPKSDSGKSAKARALKLYGELKRMKQPISPGGKLASFLNNLFSANGGSKKQRISSSSASNSNFTTNTTSSCSTASSYSRSCLSKRPSSSSTSGRYEKRSVRFCPVSVIVDEDLKPCGHKSLQGSEELKLRVMDEKRTVEEMARDLLRNYHHRSKELAAAPKDQINGGVKRMEISRDHNYMDEDDDDVESCCSSDLFELEIGVNRYCDELPVYETTRVNTNRTMATGLIA